MNIPWIQSPARTVASSNVAKLLSEAASDEKITAKEAAAIAKEIGRDGVTQLEKDRITRALQSKHFQDSFEKAASAPLRSLLKAPPAQGQAVKEACKVLGTPTGDLKKFKDDLGTALKKATGFRVEGGAFHSTQLTADELKAVKRAYDAMPLSPLKTAAYDMLHTMKIF
jgi:hypothetical protein